jgi:replicative DNA helicase
MPSAPARYNEEAEESLLGAMLLSAKATEVGTEACVPADFYLPRHGHIFAAIRDLYDHGEAVDAVTVTDQLKRSGVLDQIGDASIFVGLQANTPSIANARHYANIVRKEAAARTMQAAFSEGMNALQEQVEAQAALEVFEERVRGIDRGGKLPDRYWRDARDYLAEDHSETVAPLAKGVIYPLSRIMIVAPEKLGKSVLVRQIAFCLAAGLHPFDPRMRVNPVPTLLFDAENDDDELEPAMERVLTMIEARVGRDAPRPAVYSVPYGIDIESRRDRSDFLAVLEDAKPKLIAGGPVYKMTDQTKDLSEDRRAGLVQSLFNEVRRRWGCAVLLEHHAPTGQNGKAREVKAKGGQVWAAWVNMTVGLHPNHEDETSAEVHYPHPPRGSFRWPKRFDRGRGAHEWPWMPVLRSGNDYLDQLPVADLSVPPKVEPDWREEPF